MDPTSSFFNSHVLSILYSICVIIYHLIACILTFKQYGPLLKTEFKQRKEAIDYVFLVVYLLVLIAPVIKLLHIILVLYF